MSVDKNKILIFFIILVFLLFFGGCAEMISGSKPDAGSSFIVQVRLGADPAQSNYRYVFVYSQKAINIPVNYFIFLPGQDFDLSVAESNIPNDVQDGTSKDSVINYYYENYFSSWSDYIYLNQENGSQVQRLYDSDNLYFPVTANQESNASFTFMDLNSSGYWNFQYVSGDYHLDFQLQLAALGNNSKPLTDQTFYYNFFAINENSKIDSEYPYLQGSIKNKKGQNNKHFGTGTTTKDIAVLEITVL